MYSYNNTILVTGGTGFIGIHACFALLEKGYNLYVIDSFVNSSENFLRKIYKYIEILNKNGEPKKFRFYKGDLRDVNLIKKVFSEAHSESHSIGGVIHFAAKKSVNESIDLPIEYWENNLLGTINLIKIMQEFNCFNFIFSSSASVYGNTAKNPINELEVVNPISPYGNTKATIEKFLHDVYQSKSDNWKIILLRYFNPIGSHPIGLIGEDPTSESTNIFPKICEVALNKKDQFYIYGRDWPTKDGTCVRDYIHVMDLVEGHIKSYEYLINNKPNILTLNLGTGRGTSVNELISIFQDENKCNFNYKYADRRKGDVAICYADNSKAKITLNWEPKRSLQQMCRDGWHWYKNNF